MKLLNLDDIALDSQRTVTYKGNSYPVRDFNVSEYLKFHKHFNAFRAAYNSTEEDDMARVVDETKALVALGIPDFPVDQVDDLNPIQMLAVVSMIANLLPEPDAETVADSSTEGKIGPKKVKKARATTAD